MSMELVAWETDEGTLFLYMVPVRICATQLRMMPTVQNQML